MSRLIAWLAVSVLLLWVIWRYGFWHEALAFSVLGVTFCWIVFGAIAICRGDGVKRRRQWDKARDAAEMREAAAAAEARQVQADARR